MINLKLHHAEPSALETEIARVLKQMSTTSPNSEEYAAMADQLTKLHKLKESESSHKRVSGDTLLTVAGNLLGIVAVINYERIHVITTKATGFVMKSR